ncbi:MAG: hypothetical protein QOI36_4304 [Pseudonocardiales bacterium]|jgi:hypothetical protein|nr:hypothetical protein [Pseudonocardiales bacterium]
MEMSNVIGELHTQIVTSQHNLDLAQQAGLPYEAHQHRARLEDLMDMAARHGIDVTAWIDGPHAAGAVPYSSPDR